MHIIMSWLVFNPNDDLATLPGSRLEDMRHEIQLRDLMTMHFYPNTEATKGSTLESVLDETFIVSDGRFIAHVQPAPELLDESAKFLMTTLRWGRCARLKSAASMNRVSCPIKAVSGRLAIDIQRTVSDPDEAITRTWTGAFAAPIIEKQRRKKCGNLRTQRTRELGGTGIVHRG